MYNALRMATALLTDTHKIVTFLQNKKFSTDQAAAIVDVVNQIDISHLANKDDLRELRLDVYKALAGQTVVILGVVIAMLQFLK